MTQMIFRDGERPPVIHLAMSLDIGGVETLVVGLTRTLRDMGWPASVASNGGRRVADLEQAGVPHHVVPLHSRSPVNMLKAGHRLASLIDGLGIGLVHAHARIPAWIAEPLCKKRGIPLVTTYHGTYVSGRFWNLVSKPGDLTIAVSSDVREYVITRFGFEPDRTVVVANGIDTAYYRPPSPEEQASARQIFGLTGEGPVLVYASRMEDGLDEVAKNIQDAAEILASRHPEVALIVAGDGEGLPKIRSNANDINSRLGREAIVCPGFVLDTAPLFRAADVVLGMSRVALEGMATGRPCVIVGPDGLYGTVDKESIPALSDRNFTSRGASRPVTPQRIAQIVEGLLNEPREMESLGELGRETVAKSFSLELTTREIEKLYFHLLHKYRAGVKR